MNQSLILYGTADCHLCNLAEAYAKPIAEAHHINLCVVDIIEHDNLDAYETRIPVLKYGQHELDWPFDGAVIIAFISHTKN